MHLRLRQLVKSFDGVSNAVDGVSIDIEKGEFVTLLGPSGSGKTTTLMMIAGFEQPTAGTIELAGRDLTRVRPYHRNLGVVFQNYALFPHMTVSQNVAFPLRMRGRPAAEIGKRVAGVLDLVALRPFASRHPRELSGGQQQRVALARGLVFEPDVLLLDEPLGALDKNLREQMQVEIKRIHRSLGVTTVYVTHDQTEAMTMSDRIVVMNRGRIEQAGPPLEIYHHPLTRFVGEFIGDSNVFPATVLDGPRGLVRADTLGVTLTATCDPDLTGQEVDLLIRPERIQLAGPAEAAPGSVSLELEVEATVNYGESLLVVGSANAQRIRVRVPGGRAEAIREGGELHVAWQPGDVHVIRRAPVV